VKKDEKDGTAQKRILLLGDQSLLAEGLITILGSLKGVEVVGPWTPDDVALQRLTQGEPDGAFDLILIGNGRGESEAALAAQIMERHPDLPVAQVGLDDNAIRLYTSRALPARRADLIELVRSLPVNQRR
jgi:DNA-binding NarL/FixJ family response regulator